MLRVFADPELDVPMSAPRPDRRGTMQRLVISSLIFGILGLPGVLSAQVPVVRPGGIGYQPPAPAYRPYLNLLRQGTPAGINYVGLVRPEFATQNSLFSLQNQADLTNQRLTANLGTTMPSDLTTGRGAYFLNTGGYFLSLRPGMGATSPIFSPRQTTPGMAAQMQPSSGIGTGTPTGMPTGTR
jgi:hypothetical protein